MINPVGGAGGLGPIMPQSIEEAQKSDKSFAELFGQKIGEVNQAQLNAEKLMEKFAAGEDISPEKVMIATRKAELTFQLLLEIRNKLTESFDEIMRIQI